MRCRAFAPLPASPSPTLGRRSRAAAALRSPLSALRSAPRAIDRAVERHHVIVGAPAIVVHVGRDQVLRHGFDGFYEVAVHVGMGEIQADARPSVRRGPLRRNARANRPATARSESLPPRCVRRAARRAAAMLRGYAAQPSRLLSPPPELLRPRHAQMRHQHLDGNPSRDVQRPLGFSHRPRTRSASALASVARAPPAAEKLS